MYSSPFSCPPPPRTYRCRGNFVAGAHGTLVTVGRRPIGTVADAAAAGRVGCRCRCWRLGCTLRLLYVGNLVLCGTKSARSGWGKLEWLVNVIGSLTSSLDPTHRQAVRRVPAMRLRGPIQQQALIDGNQIRQRCRMRVCGAAHRRCRCIVTRRRRGGVVCLAIALIIAHRAKRICPVRRNDACF